MRFSGENSKVRCYNYHSFMRQLSELIKKEFKSRYQDDFILIHAPGRVNLIGEHTDYNDGFALPAAIDKRIVLAMGKNFPETRGIDHRGFETELYDILAKDGYLLFFYILVVEEFVLVIILMP